MDNWGGVAALIGIYAALVLDVFSSTNSSPQTTELFASERASSLWRWVRIGAMVAIGFVALGVFTQYHEDKKKAWAPLAGGLVALALMMLMYSHALKKGGGQKPGAASSYSNGYW